MVRPGDTLPSIAEKVYGDAGRWPAIYAANRDVIGNKPNQIKIGAQLTIPSKES